MDLSAILTELHVPFKMVGEHEHTRVGWIQIDCPNCSPRSNHFRLGINLAHGYCNCWQCGRLHLTDVLMEISQQSYHVVHELLGQTHWQRVAPKTRTVRGRLKLPRGIQELQPPHRRYLRQRGFDPDEIVRLWRVCALGITSELSWCLWIPITHNDEVVSWTARTIGDRSAARYINAKSTQETIPAKNLLYGADYARHAIVICEGPIDVWAIGPGAVAVMGLSYTRSQLVAMSKYPVRAICFDAEPDAQKRARKLARELQVFPGETHTVELESGKDAAEADPKEIEGLREEFL